MSRNNNPDVTSSVGQLEQNAKYFLAAIVESSQDSIITTDLHRKITTWNKAAELLYGYRADEVVGKSLDSVMLPKDVVELIENVNKISHEINVPIYETLRLHKNGNETDLQIALSPVRDSSGTVIGISTIARDITEAKLQEQLKDEFLAIASHELKTPLTSIKAYAQLLAVKLEKMPDRTNYSMITKLEYQIDRMMDLIKTLLDTTKLSGEVPLQIQPFDLSKLIDEQLDQLRSVSPQHQIDFKHEKTQNVLADRKLIGQVISNFVSNAVKYSPNGGQVIVSSTENGKGAKVSVQDFGIGIPDGLDHKIFERYFRVNNPYRSRIPGLGLGLYITAQIIQRHGGKIDVESKEGVGSTFSFELPLRNNERSSIV